MRNKIIALVSVAMLALGACGEDSKANNGTTGGNNNGTTAGNNGTTAGNNGTTAGNNGTTAGNNGTTAGGPSAMCNKYCDDAIATCTGNDELYMDKAQCLTACEGLTDNGTDCSAAPASCVTSGDSVQCRLYHLSVAATMDTSTHCGHAAVASEGDACADAAAPSAMCAKYCTEQGTTCTFDGANKQYDNEVSCLAACATITDSGTDCSADPATCSSDVADTIQCRLYHLNVAKTDAMTHCPHSGPAITVGVCM